MNKNMMLKIIENLGQGTLLLRTDCIIIMFFTLCAHTVDLVFNYISELYNFSVIMQQKKKYCEDHKI